MTETLLNRSEFGRRLGVNEKQVRRWIEQGKLPDRDDGKLPASLVDEGLRKPNRRKPGRSDVSDAIKPGETAEDAAERIVLEEGHAPLSLTEAVRIKENYIAKLKQLEYDLKAGEVVLISDVRAIVVAEYAKVRTRLTAIGAEVAPHGVLLNKPTELQALYDVALGEAMDELTLDRHGTDDEFARALPGGQGKRA